MLGIRSMCQVWGMMAEGAPSQLYADASATLSITKRQGAGKLCHINVKSKWMQEKEVQRVMGDEKIKGEDNSSDGLAKHVRRELAKKYSATVNLRLAKDPAKTSLQLAGGS